MQIKPLNDWAVIVPSEAAERTAGGLYIPDAAKERPAEGVVESIGPGAFEEEKWGRKKEKEKKKERKFIPTTVKPGERVIYERYAGTKIAVAGIERVLVRERSILGIFTGSASGSRPQMLPERTSSGETSLAKVALSAITASTPVRPMRDAGAGGTAKAAAGKQKASAKKAAAKKPAGKQAKGRTATRPKPAAKPKKAAKKAKKKR